MTIDNYCIGVDFGTDSVRSVLLDAHTGTEIASAVFSYPRWRAGLYCDAERNQFRQHPMDYIEGLTFTVSSCVEKAGKAIAAKVRAISVCTTGSTPVAVDVNGRPLALSEAFKDDPDAMFILWKDHTAIAEAGEINRHALESPVNYTRYSGGTYSAEWFWSKLLHVLRRNEAVRQSCFSWMEHCDWIPFLLTGGQKAAGVKRSLCAAGHKAMWAAEHGGFPPESFFSTLDPLLSGYALGLGQQVYTADQPAGRLTEEWAQRLGLTGDVMVGIGTLDAHAGAVGGQIEPYYLTKVMGTSTCDMLVVPEADFGGKFVRGICGQVKGSIVPGMIGLEAGQSAFGDAYAWFKDLLLWPFAHLPAAALETVAADQLRENVSDGLLEVLEQKASALKFDEDSELAVDWFNGRRSPYANPALKAAISNINLGSDAPRLYRAIVESTCFGAKKIVERFDWENIPVKGIVALGPIAKKSPMVMQMLADVLDLPIHTHRSEQVCASGAAMFAATVAGIFPKVEDAMAAMGAGRGKTYHPNKAFVELYQRRYRKFNELAGYFIKPYLEAGSFG